MSDSPQLPGPFSLSARLRDAQAIAGTSRHYQGPGLGVPPPWDCPTCGRQWSSDPANGCAVCIAEFRVKAEQIMNEPALTTTTTTTTGQATRAEASGRMVSVPAAPTADNARRAISPLVESRGLSGDRLADAIAEKVVERLLEQLPRAGAGAPDGAVFLPAPAELYAILVGLQLVAQGVADGAEDPLLLPQEYIHALIQQVEALPTLQSYLLLPPSAPAPVSEEPQA